MKHRESFLPIEIQSFQLLLPGRVPFDLDRTLANDIFVQGKRVARLLELKQQAERRGGNENFRNEL